MLLAWHCQIEPPVLSLKRRTTGGVKMCYLISWQPKINVKDAVSFAKHTAAGKMKCKIIL